MTGGTVALLCTLGCASSPPPPADAPESPYTIHRSPQWAIAAPTGWRSLGARALPGNEIVLFMNGDGAGGMPFVDGNLRALKIGLVLSIQTFDGGAEQLAKRELDTLSASPQFRILNDASVERIPLADGGNGHFLRTEAERTDDGRLSIYLKIFSDLKDGRVLVANGFVVGGMDDAGAFVRGCGIVDFVEAHVRSVSRDPTKLKPSSLDAAHRGYDAGLPKAMEGVYQANALVGHNLYDEAIQLFRGALGVCDHMAAAHNGLAWSLVSKGTEIPAAVQHARRAVAMTARKDAAALDTLATAHFAAGDKAQAIATIEEAIVLRPDVAELKERLEKFQR